MVLVVDFDGTLVKENSTKLLEVMIFKRLGLPENVIDRIGVLFELTSFVLGRIIRYKGDFGRYLLILLFANKFGVNELFKLMKHVAEQLTVRELFKNKKRILTFTATILFLDTMFNALFVPLSLLMRSGNDFLNVILLGALVSWQAFMLISGFIVVLLSVDVFLFRNIYKNSGQSLNKLF